MLLQTTEPYLFKLFRLHIKCVFGICLFVLKRYFWKKGRATSIIELVDTLLSDRYTHTLTHNNNNKIRKTSKHT